MMKPRVETTVAMGPRTWVSASVARRDVPALGLSPPGRSSSGGSAARSGVATATVGPGHGCSPSGVDGVSTAHPRPTAPVADLRFPDPGRLGAVGVEDHAHPGEDSGLPAPLG